MPTNHLDLSAFRQLASGKAATQKKFLQRLAKQPSEKVDSLFHQAHQNVFSTLNCLTCAHCCRTTSPIFYSADIERAARILRLRPATFIETYLRIDEEGDYVLQAVPCPFLQEDNHCSIYEHRPKACKEYPHTDRKKIIQIMPLTMRNTQVCPAVFEMVESIRRQVQP